MVQSRTEWRAFQNPYLKHCTAIQRLPLATVNKSGRIPDGGADRWDERYRQPDRFRTTDMHGSVLNN